MESGGWHWPLRYAVWSLYLYRQAHACTGSTRMARQCAPWPRLAWLLRAVDSRVGRARTHTSSCRGGELRSSLDARACLDNDALDRCCPHRLPPLLTRLRLPRCSLPRSPAVPAVPAAPARHPLHHLRRTSAQRPAPPPQPWQASTRRTSTRL
jgi:hypothetical protein